jgi:hypothetical protein
MSAEECDGYDLACGWAGVVEDGDRGRRVAPGSGYIEDGSLGEAGELS